MLEARGLHFAYPTPDGTQTILSGVDLHISPGTSTAIIGPSGTGKSTLLHLLGLLDQPNAGSIHWQKPENCPVHEESLEREESSEREESLQRDNTHDATINLTALNGAAQSRWRSQHLGFVFQAFHLLSDFTCLENVALAAQAGGAPRAQAQQQAEALLAELQLTQLAHKRPQQVSGGERQRIALARAVVHKPAIILADEPTGNLDPTTGKQVLDLLLQRCSVATTSLVLVTHDHDIAAACDRTLTLANGALVDQ
jgi:lipoprotein-releasing system ATP-binding protein